MQALEATPPQTKPMTRAEFMVKWDQLSDAVNADALSLDVYDFCIRFGLEFPEGLNRPLTWEDVQLPTLR